MKKVLTVILTITLAFSMVSVFTACSGKKDTTTAAAETSSPEQAETAVAEDAKEEISPKAGETLRFGTMNVKIPDNWSSKDYKEGQKVELHPKEDSFEYVGITMHKVSDGNHAKEWAKKIEENYEGKQEIDEIEIGGKTFYRVKADPEQNVCFADIDDKNYIEVAVMFMPWEDGKAALSNISFN